MVTDPPVSYQEFVDLKEIPPRRPDAPSTGLVLIARNPGYRIGEAYRGLYSATLWGYNASEDRFEPLVAPFSYSDQAEFQVRSRIGDKNMTCLLLAEFVWGKREGRYQPHRYMIDRRRPIPYPRQRP